MGYLVGNDVDTLHKEVEHLVGSLIGLVPGWSQAWAIVAREPRALASPQALSRGHDAYLKGIAPKPPR